RARLSVVVITKNEEPRIGRCLESVRWADELIVVDGESTDRTVEICRQYGATVLPRPFDDFSSQANYGLAHLTGDWVLSLEADGVVTPALRERIQDVLVSEPSHAGFTCQRFSRFLGRPMRHGEWFRKVPCLFRRQAGRFVGSVHHGPQLAGTIGHLEAEVEHEPIQSIAQFIERQNWYTSREAEAFRAQGPSLSNSRLRYQVCIRPATLFWESYVKKGGWREGMYGLVFGVLFAWVEFLKWAKYWAFTCTVEQATAPATGQRLEEGEQHRPARLAPGSERARLSVVLITKNEEARIARCLESVRWADEWIVVDGQSTDRTVEICRQYGAAVITHPFCGDFGHERNLGNDAAAGDWILQLDADDVVSRPLRAQIERILREGSPYAAYKFRRKNWFLGHEMRYGGWYHYYPHLFRRGQAYFEGRVHHLLRAAGPLGTLEGELEHRPFDSLEQFVARHNRYTSLEAQELWDHHGPASMKLLRYQLAQRPLKLFWKMYVKKQGFREGWHGWVFAVLFTWVHVIKWAKYWELGLRRSECPALPPPAPGHVDVAAHALQA
ncbi:MAG: glycosyltransferase family 2 protein, partial [Candidatus Omnitrophica bacterium]|nr:glycosyltransferase family 2 protein [Candidatus Omnitrophota bacterium]